MAKISFGNPIEPMGPYYSEVDLNDQPMSPQSLAILEKLIEEAEGSLACELKEDGFRCQVHVDGQDIKLFTRGSGEFEVRCFPEIVRGLQELGLEKTIIDGELRGSVGKYDGFKAMQARARYAGRINEKALREYLQKKPQEFPVQLVAFDVLMSRGVPQIQETNETRRALLEEVLGEDEIIVPVSRTIAETPQEIIWLYAQKVQKEKCEGIVLKQPQLEYFPSDKKHWVKLKKFEPLDLVVLGLSHGKSPHEYSQALVGSYYPERDVYQSLGFVNLIRENPATGNLFADDIGSIVGKKRRTPPQNVEVRTKSPDIYVNPAVILEVQAMNIDRGNDFACSVDDKTFYSLRIAYVRGIREDKKAEQATTTDFVAAYCKNQR
ncbi:MAG: RNA ligase family protein [Nanoarchaeota archaeon]|nr:RNA ligase family protein [Nanoarchaeota archaeon]